VSDQITPAELLRLAANESIISAVLKWAAANGRRLNKADLERMGQGVDAMVEENERLTRELASAIKERDEARTEYRKLDDYIEGYAVCAEGNESLTVTGALLASGTRRRMLGDAGT
jgi:predicted TIM-barrel fold metal-dependent hydrolase